MSSLRSIGRLAVAVRSLGFGPKCMGQARFLTNQSPSRSQSNLGKQETQKSELPTESDDAPGAHPTPISDKLLHLNTQVVQHEGIKSDESTRVVNKPDKLYKTIELEILAYEQTVLDSYQWFVLTAASHLQLQVGKIWQPIKFSRHLTVVNKSAFVHKKARVHYEVRTYYRYINLHKLTGSTADTFLEYIQRNLPEGVGLKVTKAEALPLPDFLQGKTKVD